MKKILFVTGTRADYGKLKSLIKITQKSKKFKTYVFVTGMHMLKIYGSTYLELQKDKIKNIILHKNQKDYKNISLNLAQLIKDFNFVREKFKPDLVVVHGDRMEPLGCALDSVINNTKVAHIEGGEVSGTIDELFRHAISKISQFHFITNKTAKKRLIQMGEKKENIFIIGSPDVDVILSKKKPNISKVKIKYNINFANYSIAILHPVTIDIKNFEHKVKIFFDSLKESKKNFIIIYPNNDYGSQIILKEIKKLKNNKNFRIIPSMRFEYFLTLLENSNLIVGNSSSGIMEAPYYGVKTINVGNRQFNRFRNQSIININFNKKNLVKNIKAKTIFFKKTEGFGSGNSDMIFFKIINSKKIWKYSTQKYFQDLI